MRSRSTRVAVAALLLLVGSVLVLLSWHARGHTGPRARPEVTTAPLVRSSPLIPSDSSAGPSPSSHAHVETYVTLGAGDRLVLGPDHHRRVHLRWVRRFYAPETFAVGGDRVYVADETAVALDLADGSTVWSTGDPSDEALVGDGGVQIGLVGPHVVDFFAPYNYDVRVDRETGALLRLHHGVLGRRPRDVRLLPRPRPTVWSVHTRYDTSGGTVTVVTTGRLSPGGPVSWRLVTTDSEFDPSRAVAVPGGVVLMTAAGNVVCLDVSI